MDVAWDQLLQREVVLPPPPETTVILSKENTFLLFKASSHGLFESDLYCIDSITTEHANFFLKEKWNAFEQMIWNDVS